MTAVIYLLLASNAASFVGIALLSRKVHKIEYGLMMSSRVMASIGKDFLKSQGKAEVNMFHQIHAWANQDNGIHAPNCNCDRH